MITHLLVSSFLLDLYETELYWKNATGWSPSTSTKYISRSSAKQMVNNKNKKTRRNGREIAIVNTMRILDLFDGDYNEDNINH